MLETDTALRLTKGGFNGDYIVDNWVWIKKERLSEQLQFFKAKKTKFISVYAKKPRILINQSTPKMRGYNKSPDALEALYQSQMMRGIQNSALGCVQMSAAGQAQAAGQAASQNCLLSFGGAGLSGLGLQGLI